MDPHMEFSAAPLAPPLLNRSQLAQKIGARDNDYPRPHGVLVPRALDEMCSRRLIPIEDRKDLRKDVGRDVVLQTSRALRSLGREVLDLPMPHPSVALRSLAIENRTRSVIDRTAAAHRQGAALDRRPLSADPQLRRALPGRHARRVRGGERLTGSDAGAHHDDDRDQRSDPAGR